MRRFIALMLALAMCLALASCSKKKTEEVTDETETTSPVIETVTDEVSEEETDDVTVVEEENDFDPIVVLDNDTLNITVVGLDTDDTYGYDVYVTITNKSDTTYIVEAITATVDGVECDPYFADSIEAGVTSEETVAFDFDTLKENGVTDYSDLYIMFGAYDAENWEATDISADVHIYPNGEENATTYVRESQSSDIVLIDNDDVTVIATGFKTSYIYGYEMDLYLINKTDTDIMFFADDVTVNGFDIDPYYSEAVMGHSSAFSKMWWDEDELMNNGFSLVDVTNIQFNLSAYDYKTYDVTYFADEPISIDTPAVEMYD